MELLSVFRNKYLVHKIFNEVHNIHVIKCIGHSFDMINRYHPEETFCPILSVRYYECIEAWWLIKNAYALLKDKIRRGGQHADSIVWNADDLQSICEVLTEPSSSEEDIYNHVFKIQRKQIPTTISDRKLLKSCTKHGNTELFKLLEREMDKTPDRKYINYLKLAINLGHCTLADYLYQRVRERDTLKINTSTQLELLPSNTKIDIVKTIINNNMGKMDSRVFYYTILKHNDLELFKRVFPEIVSNQINKQSFQDYIVNMGNNIFSEKSNNDQVIEILEYLFPLLYPELQHLVPKYNDNILGLEDGWKGQAYDSNYVNPIIIVDRMMVSRAAWIFLLQVHLKPIKYRFTSAIELLFSIQDDRINKFLIESQPEHDSQFLTTVAMKYGKPSLFQQLYQVSRPINAFETATLENYKIHQKYHNDHVNEPIPRISPLNGERILKHCVMEGNVSNFTQAMNLLSFSPNSTIMRAVILSKNKVMEFLTAMVTEKPNEIGQLLSQTSQGENQYTYIVSKHFPQIIKLFNSVSINLFNDNTHWSTCIFRMAMFFNHVETYSHPLFQDSAFKKSLGKSLHNQQGLDFFCIQRNSVSQDKELFKSMAHIRHEKDFYIFDKLMDNMKSIDTTKFILSTITTYAVTIGNTRIIQHIEKKYKICTLPRRNNLRIIIVNQNLPLLKLYLTKHTPSKVDLEYIKNHCLSTPTSQNNKIYKHFNFVVDV